MSDTDQPDPGAEEPTPDSGAEEQPDPEPGDASAQDGGERDDTDGGPNREAAKWRRRLRGVEGERDRLAGVVEQYQIAAVERLATTGPAALASGSDLWKAGVDLAELIDDDGAVDAERVGAAVARVVAEQPHWRRPAADLGQGVRTPASTPPPDLASIMRDRQRG